MANNFSTHTIRTYPSKNVKVLFRNRDGMVIAGVDAGSCVNFGEDPSRPQSRQFISQTHATAFLRKVADADQREHERSIAPFEKDGSTVDYEKVTARIEEDSDTNLTVVKH